ncbi:MULTISPECIES: helix-turn-helix domain-containing protein [unclassified Chryseobacterium]|uniref:helix-turn-helix domain-containing protein n=1 Tax=unclassified Chryseobacterium TaxID=2593645 RepID=UPI00069AE168|nr:helix-turn-helix domain-containing protein [Chryseobacterium sp. Y16C]UMQ41641.1 helix-turn-helix domain-containing protein [Chryseobacterium sp. Y16C]
MKKILFLLTFTCKILCGQDFSDYRIQYDNYEENDVRAFTFINQYIKKAKEEKNYTELAQAYKDATSFSPDKKLQYADSMIWAASRTRSKDLIGSSYLTKGTIYYFNLKKFKFALNEYLKAWNYLEHTNDEYLYYKNLYHIGVVKSYLGHYEEAVKVFEKCRAHYGAEKAIANLPNLSYNNKKGFLNSLQQNASCLVELNRLEEARLLINEGLKKTAGDIDFYIERSYFYKLQGIIDFKNKNYNRAISNFNNALAGVEKKNDFTNISAVYFYKGKSLLHKNKLNEAIQYFKKVDSIFKKHEFILPEVRESYEILINFSKNTNNDKKELYYTKQLLKVDHILSTDFKYLSEKIHKEYDTKDLLQAKRRLEISSTNGYSIAFVLFFFLLVLFLILFFRWQNEKRIQEKYNELLAKMKSDAEQKPAEKVDFKLKNSKLNEEKANELLSKLTALERENFFLEKSMTLNKLSIKLKTNTTYLSEIINDYKGCNFNTYLNQLRISYITQKLYEDKLWRKYSTNALSAEAGFTNKSKFSKAFYNRNGLSPIEFIRKRNKELGDGV